jgi:hypothetical protein
VAPSYSRTGYADFDSPLGIIFPATDARVTAVLDDDDGQSRRVEGPAAPQPWSLVRSAGLAVKPASQPSYRFPVASRPPDRGTYAASNPALMGTFCTTTRAPALSAT